MLNRHLVEADVRIITGFIEPHFFAGFSGGPKGIMPGVAGQHTVERNHGAAMIGHPNATWGVTFGNPLWEEMLEVAQRVDPPFPAQRHAQRARQITRVFAGDLVEAHRAGCAFVKQTAMQPVDAPFEIVVTTNSGHPLDLNLYQAVKGMSAAARIVKPGGLMILACECREGLPAGSPFDQFLPRVAGPEELLARLAAPGFCFPEQWQAQIQALIQRKARVLVYSTLSEDAFLVLREAGALRDIGAEVRDGLQAHGDRRARRRVAAGTADDSWIWPSRNGDHAIEEGARSRIDGSRRCVPPGDLRGRTRPPMANALGARAARRDAEHGTRDARARSLAVSVGASREGVPRLRAAPGANRFLAMPFDGDRRRRVTAETPSAEWLRRSAAGR